MEIKFFFENDSSRRSYNFRSLVGHIDEYLKEHPNLEFNKIEHCGPDGREVYALVSFKENESKLALLEGLVQTLTAKNEVQRLKIEELEQSLSLAKESLFGKNIINDVNKDVVESIKNACPEGHPAKKIAEEMLQPNDVPDEVIDKMIDGMDKGLSTREVVDGAISSLDDMDKGLPARVVDNSISSLDDYKYKPPVI